ncbi:dipeptide ABC transporter ATP-binding protein [Rugosimonospora africana]|uniref:ABC transporter ATP-binding protein n=1 Tax=Rugosimonospora africana TaxID=556532 RepID=A0A8J3R0C2_9ACTN|nr:ABC transporter ATP-binding protein [Rugosimonospora africana]GIH20178.1 ABC transporter ATP-binding protein [Rugosimonospora africana]
MTVPLVEVADLRVAFADGPVVDGISFTLHRGQCLALVGESGSGKSVTARTLIGLTGYRSRVSADRLAFDGADVTGFTERNWRRVRGAQVGFILQDALASLDSLRPVGREIAEPLRLHTTLNRQQRDEKVRELLASVGVPEPEVRARQYPHQLSGGLRQRALIASAIACDPALLIADEPTTALDATVAVQVLALLERLKGSETGLLMVSHDLSVVARLADRVAVLRAGRIVEEGPTERVLHDPRHSYTKALLAAVPVAHAKGARLSAGPAPALAAVLAGSPRTAGTGPVIEARGLFKSFPGPDGDARSAVTDVSLTLNQAETLGIVGESGSGKTTTARMLLGLENPDAGEVRVDGQPLAQLPRAARRRLQFIYQDPLSSFDPRFTVRRVIGEALRAAGHPRGERRPRTLELLELVALDPGVLRRRPLELSGGQRQRVAIARALAARPEVIVCDEPVSALDVSVQAQILDLLTDLQQSLGLAYLFISHDLGVIYHVSDRVLVMKDGAVVESNSVSEVFAHPQHKYTKALLAAIPRLETAHRRPADQSAAQPADNRESAGV